MLETIIERLKSKVVWASVLAQVLLIIAIYNPAIADNVKITTMAIIEILTLIGVLNNPADKDNF